MLGYLKRYRKDPASATKEIFSIFRFALVGIVATGVHLSVAFTLAFIFNVNISAANIVAFLTAFLFSFSGHFYWTFPKTGVDRRTALRRFLVVAVFAFSVNNLLLVWLLRWNLVSEGWALVFAVLVVPIASYTGARIWAFRK